MTPNQKRDIQIKGARSARKAHRRLQTMCEILERVLDRKVARKTMATGHDFDDFYRAVDNISNYVRGDWVVRQSDYGSSDF